MNFSKYKYIFLSTAIFASSLIPASLPLPAEAADLPAPTEALAPSATEASASSSSSSSAKKRSSKKRSSKKKSSWKSSKKRSGSKGSSKKKRSSSKKKNRHSSKSKRSSKKRYSRGKRGNVARSVYKAPPKEQAQNDSLTLAINKALLDWVPANLNPGGLRVNSVKPNKYGRSANVSLNENFTYLPVTRELITSIEREVAKALPDSLKGYRVNLNVGNKSLNYYITKVDRLPEQYRKNPNFVKEVHPMTVATKGMENDIIALWSSHGRYFKPGSGAWMWQRPLLFQTVEDTYTMGYILPFVTPMLENAGAYVMLPRERDTNRNEVIVDNDTNDEGQIFSQPYYKEQTGQTPWETGEFEGFIYDLPDFRDTENPFENGTYRQTQTQKGGKPSVAAWYADIPAPGEYAVYVSYKTLPNSTSDAHYTVNYSGGSKEFTVNQKMGGGTWIYLGTFPLEAGYSDEEPVVTLTNITSGAAGTVVTADAVKIGGGMGNIARSNRRSDVYYDPSTPVDDEEADDEAAEDEEDEGDDTGDNGNDAGEGNSPDGGEAVAEQSDDITDSVDIEEGADKKEAEKAPEKRGPAPTFRTSGYPRFLEGARYWLHWAGFPEYVYSPYHGTNDYKDDYTSRGHWVNYLAGGSRVLPDREGLNIPVDAAFALHSDAGKRSDDSYVGTLGIYFTQNGGSYQDGTARINSRMLTDLIMQQIHRDVRQEYEPNWKRRSMWDKSYVEARVPEVPTTLIELMSHQNFADMKYGLDPGFRFTVGRAIYKGLARFMAERKGRELVIQPLPVNNFSIKRTRKDHYQLSWAPTPDPLEPTAMPSKYIIMERTGDDLGFHKIGETKGTHFDINVTDDEIHSFQIIAANAGGTAFPSETLALREAPDGSKPILIVNGFTRISGPGNFSAGGEAGFDAEADFGVPYIKDISFTGYQTEFRRSAGESFGRSGQNYATTVIAGNTFDYPAVHGAAAAAMGKGFVSASASAVEKGDVKLSDYPVVDLILGKQRSTVVGTGKRGVEYRAFPEPLRKALRRYSDKGGDLIITGQYAASDLTGMRSQNGDRDFAEQVLGVSGAESDMTRRGTFRDNRGQSYDYSNTLNEKNYIVESPDVLTAAENAHTTTLATMADGTKTVGIINNRGKSKGQVALLTIPLESITDAKERARIFNTMFKAVTTNK